MSFIRLFRAGACALLTLALSSTIAVAQGNGHGHDKHEEESGPNGGAARRAKAWAAAPRRHVRRVRHSQGHPH